jgi:hypothetical protein
VERQAIIPSEEEINGGVLHFLCKFQNPFINFFPK